VMQARAVIGIADIHAWPLAHGIEALQHLDAVCALTVLIGIGRAVAAGGVFTHGGTIGQPPAKPKLHRSFST
jgi:hypothetical protein